LLVVIVVVAMRFVAVFKVPAEVRRTAPPRRGKADQGQGRDARLEKRSKFAGKRNSTFLVIVI
jgi:hypothetical protein